MARRPFDATYTEMTSRPLESLHVDLCGPFRVQSLNKNKYMMTVVDVFSRRYFVEFLRTKDQTKNALQNLINRRENELNSKVKKIRTDNGLEFINEEMNDYLIKKGIKHEKTTFYSPRSNGIAERANRTLLDTARTLLIDSQLPLTFWSEAVATAAYIHNITPTKSRKDKTPMELWNSKKPSVRHLKPFGCLAYYKIDENKRHKLEAKAKKGIFIGYSRERKAYRIYDIVDERIYETSDVIFNEKKKGYISQEKDKNETNYLELDYFYEDKSSSLESQENSETNNEPENIETKSEPENSETNKDRGNTNTNNDQEKTGTDEEGNSLENSNLNEPSMVNTDVKDQNSNKKNEQNENQLRSLRKNRNKKMPIKYSDYQVYIAKDDIPIAYENAIISKDREQWKIAMEEELNSLNLHEVWEKVKRPKNQKIIKSRWIYTIKDNGDIKQYKARLVAAGYGQKRGIDFEESFSPVMKWDTLRTLLAISAERKSIMKFYDVKTAYLNGNLEENIYMEAPPGYKIEDDMVLEIKKSIYGLPQSGRCWYNKFSEILGKAGLKRLKSDPCVFTKADGKEYIHIGVYVDDFLIIASSETIINKILKHVRDCIEIKETTENGMFLGMRIEQKNDEIIISQKNYSIKVLEKFEMQDCKPVKTPSLSNDNYLDNHTESKIFPQQKYQEAIGSLMYLAIGTRPDIAHTISKLSQYSLNPKEIHWIAIKRVLRYLKGTLNYCLKLKPNKGNLNGCTDASWCTTLDGKSFSGYLLKIGQAVVSWKSGKQKLVALSTMEAELIAACDAVCAVKWMSFLLEELQEQPLISRPITIETDSKSLIDWIKNPRVSCHTRHINRKFHFIKDDVQSGEIQLIYKNTRSLEADALTKHLPYDILKEHMIKCGIEPDEQDNRS